MSVPTAVVGTGVANTASVVAALRRVGADPVITTDPLFLATAERVVLPGVGSFAAGMARLREAGLVEVLRERVRLGRPTAGICLGLQLLCEGSEEAPGVEGLGVIEGTLTRFEAGQKVPQLGWNRVRVPDGSGLLTDGSAYFANSYRLATAPAGWRAATSDYGGRFVAALERGPVLACQFHPELSGPWGLELLRRWVGQQPAVRAIPAQPDRDGSLAVRLLPCLDVRDGRVVKGIRFQGLRDAGDPAERAADYAVQGADELVLLDVSATDEGRAAALQTIAAVRARIALPLTVGGGVRTVADAEALLAAGADKVSVNTAAVRDPALLTRLAERFGRQCAVVAIDARRNGASWEVVVRAGKEGTGLDAVDWAAEAVARGAGEILLTSMDRDGTQSGYDLDLLRAVSQRVDVPVIASGGARTAAHLAEAVAAGASAVLAASILHDADTTVDRLKDGMAAAGVEVRR